MSDFAVLDVFLHNQLITSLTHLPGDKNLFLFKEEYINDKSRSILSLSFKDIFGDLITDIKPTRTRLPSFFSNLLPEGHMREYLALQAKVNPQREFFLLAALGKDLPGALKVLPSNRTGLDVKNNKDAAELIALEKDQTALHFSLAGIQLKFSAILENQGGLTIPADGTGGSWIVKLPSSVYRGVPENEYIMLELARHIGIDVPQTALVSMDQIHGLPKGIGSSTSHAFIIKRFDRTVEGHGIHIEDFAQVLGLFPEKKYRFANYQNIAFVIQSEIGDKGIIEFIRRFVFNALIGNGDMHLKNWSLIYPDKKNAALAPAYDFVSTIPYLSGDELVLNFMDSKTFDSLTYLQFKRFADKAQISEALVLETVQQTSQAFRKIWSSIRDFQLDQEIVSAIKQHLKTIPFYNA